MTHDSNDSTAKATGPVPGAIGSRVGRDLWPRVWSGLVLAAIALAATVFGATPFVLMIGLVSAIVSWEWGRIVRGQEADVVAAAHLGAVIAAVVLAMLGLPGLALLGTAIGMILVALLSFGRHGVLSAAGVAYAALPAVALIWVRRDEPDGMAAVLFLMAIVVATDTAAYFSGRLIGGPKLLARLSPNKTWAGLIGAIVASALTGAAIAKGIGGINPVQLGLAGAALAIVAQAGDFAESALKRQFGAKDASHLIPGHGGFMDRVDGLIAVAIVAGLTALWINVHAPAQALLLR